MAENITTLLEKPDAENVQGSDYLYIVQGSGSKRDRKIKLEALFASEPAHTLVVDEQDTVKKRYLAPAFFRGSDSGNFDIFFSASDITRDGAKVRVIGAFIGIEKVTTNKLANDAVTNAKIAMHAVSNGSLADKSVSTEKIIDGNVTTAKIADDAVTPEKIDETGDYTVKSMTVKTSLDSVVLKGNVSTDNIYPKTVGQNIIVNGGFTITMDVSAKSVATEKISCSKLSLNENGMAYAPALPYFVDTAYYYDGDLSRYCAGAPSGGRVTFVNATGSNQTYHFNGGANGKSGYFTLKDGHAVDLLVFEAQSSTQVSLVPIGIDFSTGN